MLGGVSTSSSSSGLEDGVEEIGRVGGGALHPILGGNGGNMVEDGGGEEKSPKSLRGEAAISESDVGGEEGGGGKGPHLIFKHLTRSERS